MKLHQFIITHPLTACVLTAVMSSMVTCYAVLWALHQPPDAIDAFLVAMVFAGVCLVVAGTCKRVIPVVLAMALVGNVKAEDPKPLPLLIAGGALILIAGGVIGCRAVKKCSRIAHAKTNAWPDEVEFQVAGEFEYGAYISAGAADYCVERFLSVEPTVFSLTISVGSNGVLNTSMNAVVGWVHAQDWSSFIEESASHGLAIVESIDPYESYSRNQQPCFAEDTPIHFNRETGVVTVNGGGVKVTVERSEDLIHWEPMLALNVPVGSNIPVDDVGNGGFYRVTGSKP